MSEEMTATETTPAVQPGGRKTGSTFHKRKIVAAIDTLLPILVLAIILGLIFYLRPNVLSYFGLNLLLKLAVPLILAALSQMLILALGDLDLSTGSFVGFATCVCAVHLAQSPLLAIAILVAGVLGYAAVGLLIQTRQLPSIVVTLGMSFVWLGLALLILPSPGGRAPDWLIAIPGIKPPFLPFPVWFAVGAIIVFEYGLMRSSWGVILRGVGGNPKAIQRAGWSVLSARVAVYCAAGTCGVLAGLMLSGLTTSGAPNIAPSYTLLSIAAVILGGGAFVGGVISPIGTVVGAITLSLVGSVLTFLHVPSVWQIGAQGGILILVLIGRGLTRHYK